MSFLSWARRNNQGGTVEFSAPDCCQGRLLFKEVRWFLKKRICAGAAVLCLAAILLLSGCSKAQPLPDGMDEESTGAAAREIVALLLDGDYQAVVDAFRPDLREEYSVTAGLIEEMMDSVSDAGAYVETTKTLVLGGSSKSFDEPYAAAAVYCEHESKDVIYEISLDTDMNVIGLQLKEKKQFKFGF